MSGNVGNTSVAKRRYRGLVHYSPLGLFGFVKARLIIAGCLSSCCGGISCLHGSALLTSVSNIIWRKMDNEHGPYTK